MMEKITKDQILKIIENSLSPHERLNSFQFSNTVYKSPKGENVALINIFDKHRQFIKYTLCLDYNFQILNILKNPHYSPSDEELNLLFIGKYLDVTDLDDSFKKEDLQGSHSTKTKILGRIKNERIELLDMSNYLDFPKDNTVSDGHCYDLFKEIAIKYQSFFTTLQVNHEYFETSLVTFDHPKAKFKLKLSKNRFNYDFNLSIHPVYTDETISLNSNTVNQSEFITILNDVLEGRGDSLLVKSLLVLNGSSSNNSNHYSISESDKTTSLVKISYDSRKSDLSGTYTFKLNFKNKTVECIDNKKSTSYIPKEIEKLTHYIRDIA